MRKGKTRIQTMQYTALNSGVPKNQSAQLHFKHYTVQGKQLKYFPTVFVQQMQLFDKYSNILQNTQFIHFKKNWNTLSANIVERN